MLGVIDAVSGYADGEGVRATYREITKLKNKFNNNNHAEVVEVTYNKNVISTEELLMHYFESHDPTQINRQGNDIGTQYRSIILYSTEEQKKVIDRVLQTFRIRRLLLWGDNKNIQEVFGTWNSTTFDEHHVVFPVLFGTRGCVSEKQMCK